MVAGISVMTVPSLEVDSTAAYAAILQRPAGDGQHPPRNKPPTDETVRLVPTPP
jgi:hypothetical protein